VQVDPMKPKLKPPGTKLLKLKCDKLLSNHAFKINLRLYTEAGHTEYSEETILSSLIHRGDLLKVGV